MAVKTFLPHWTFSESRLVTLFLFKAVSVFVEVPVFVLIVILFFFVYFCCTFFLIFVVVLHEVILHLILVGSVFDYFVSLQTFRLLLRNASFLFVALVLFVVGLHLLSSHSVSIYSFLQFFFLCNCILCIVVVILWTFQPEIINSNRAGASPDPGPVPVKPIHNPTTTSSIRMTCVGM